MTATYKLPPRFYDDHRSRDLPESGTSTLVRKTKAYVIVEMDVAAFDDLRSDCVYYSDGSQFDRELTGLSLSARATLTALDAQGRPAPEAGFAPGFDPPDAT